MKILSFGSLNIDYRYKVDHFVCKGETISSKEMGVFTGGKGLNQSIALAKAGADVYHAGIIGKDGEFLLDAMKQAGVNTDLVRVKETSHTGNAIIQIDVSGDNCILLHGGANQEISREYADEVLSAFDKGDLILLQNEINLLDYIMEEAHKKGILIALNPSPMDDKILKLPLDLVDCFILNETEAQKVTDTTEKDPELLAEALHQHFPKGTFVLTVGANGSLFRDSQKTYRQHGLKVETVDTTAAGDTYTGFYLAAIADGKSIEEAMNDATIASAIAVTRDGAAPSIPDRQEVREYVR